MQPLRPLGFLQPVEPDGGDVHGRGFPRLLQHGNLRHFGFMYPERKSSIDSCKENPTSVASASKLPDYFQVAGRIDDLLRFLSPDYFSLAIERCQSLAPLRHTAQLGVSAALQRSNRDPDLIRFLPFTDQFLRA